MKTPKNFARYLHLAQRFLKAGRLPGLLLSVLRKREKAGVAMSALGRDLQLLQGLCMAWWRGEYRAIDGQALLAVVAALLYFLAPFDALPDWLPLLGFVDDLAVLTWVMHRWRHELEAFRAWREAQSPETLRVIERLPLDPQAEIKNGRLQD
jgi:uncharacterized membrane protein YkvA (DUF1232 family)